MIRNILNKIWFQCGKRHREDGPATINFWNGVKREKYYLYGNQIRKELFPLMSPGFKIKSNPDAGRIINQSYADDGTLLIKIEGKYIVNP